MILTPENLRAARAFLGWSMRDLEEHSGVSRQTINALEGAKRKRAPYADTVDTLVSTFAAHGVEILPPPMDGVRRIPRP